MELLCPECRGTLATEDGKSARCTLHGGEYRILFQKSPAPVMPALAVAGQCCVRHPSMPAQYTCVACGSPICAACAFPQPNATYLCPGCVGRPVPVPSWGRGPGQDLYGLMCAMHPAVQAVRRCSMCGAAMCSTCDFQLPGMIHVCPKCAVNPRTRLSSRRKRTLAWAYTLAVWCTLGLALLLSGALANEVRTEEDVRVLGLVMWWLLFVPSLVGTALGFATFDRRLSNPPSVWAAAIWNGVVLGVLLILTIIGNLM